MAGPAFGRKVLEGEPLGGVTSILLVFGGYSFFLSWFSWTSSFFDIRSSWVVFYEFHFPCFAMRIFFCGQSLGGCGRKRGKRGACFVGLLLFFFLTVLFFGFGSLFLFLPPTFFLSDSNFFSSSLFVFFSGPFGCIL